MKKFLLAFTFLFLLQISSAQVNVGFELSTPGQYFTTSGVAGWTVQSTNNVNGSCSTTTLPWSTAPSEFWIATTPILAHPFLGTIPNSPLGGTQVAQLQNTTPGLLMTRLSQTFSVTTSNSLFEYVFCGSWDGYSHVCCDAPFARVELYNCAGVLQSCFTMSVVPAAGCPTSATLSLSSGFVGYTSWQYRAIDLTPFIGSCVTIRVLNGDCSAASHHGSTYFDARTSSQSTLPNLTTINPGSPVAYCSGSSLATISAPSGYISYSWTPPFGSPLAPGQNTLSTITITNPVSANVYTVNMMASSGCQFVATYTIMGSNVSIAALGTSSTCLNGTSGSATVQGAGSGSGYNYSWYNSSSLPVGTTSVLTNVSPGIYSIAINAVGAPSCGSAVATVTIGVATPSVTLRNKPFCGSQAYMSVTGANVVWYNGTVPMSTMPSLTLTPTNNQQVTVAYTSPQGCRDSIRYTLISTIPGSITVSSSTVCPNSASGTATITLPPNTVLPGTYNFSVTSIGTTAPYTSTLVNSSSPTYTVNTLVGGGNYSITGFDGSCYYGSTFAAPSYSFDFGFNTGSSFTVCNGGGSLTIVSFSNSFSLWPTAYTFSWSPNIYLSGNVANQYTTIITPVVAAGSQTTITYSVLVTPTVANCPITKTVSIKAYNLVTPTITAIPNLCTVSGPYTITALPGGGYFSGSSLVSSPGIITPTVSGFHNLNYTYTTSICAASAAGNFQVFNSPTLAVTGNTNMCVGESTTLTASGAQTYSWLPTGSTSSISVTPLSNTIYTVTGIGINNCTSTLGILVSPVPQPTLLITGNNVCTGQPGTVAVSGAISYSWNTGSTANFTVVNLTAPAAFTVTGFNSSQCNSTTTINVAVVPFPTITLTGNLTVCKGAKATLTASGASSYVWSDGSSAATFSVIGSLNSIFTLTATTIPGNCSSSKTFILNVAECTGMDEISSGEEKLLLFPNPNAGNFTLSLISESDISIFNCIGELVHSQKFDAGKTDVDLSTLPAGVYTIVSDSNQSLSTSKFVVVR